MHPKNSTYYSCVVLACIDLHVICIPSPFQLPSVICNATAPELPTQFPDMFDKSTRSNYPYLRPQTPQISSTASVTLTPFSASNAKAFRPVLQSSVTSLMMGL